MPERGEKNVKKFKKALSFIIKTGWKGLGKLLFKEVRENLFGDSIRCMISGGGAISGKVLEFFNAIGYNPANGYGMSEAGITSVEQSSSFKMLCSATVGKPFGHIEYKISGDGELLIRGKPIASAVYENGERKTISDGWYNSQDIAEEKNGVFKRKHYRRIVAFG